MRIGKKTGIYLITSPTGRVYVGQSRDISKRFTSYKGISKKNEGQPKLYNSLVKHGAKNHKFEVLEVCTLEELNIKERYWQDHYDACSRKNLNCTLTSTDEKPAVISEETRKKHSIRMKGVMIERFKCPLFRAKMRRAYDKLKGRKKAPATDEYREFSRQREIKKGNWKGEKNPWFGVDRSGEKNTRWGAVLSEETKAKISEKAKGRLHNDDAKEKISQANALGANNKAKLVLNHDNGVFFSCGKEAWMSTNMKIAYTTFKCQLNGWNKNKTPFKYV